MPTTTRVYRVANDVTIPTRLNGGDRDSNARIHFGCRNAGRYRYVEPTANAQRDQCRIPTGTACLGRCGNASGCRAYHVGESEAARVFLAMPRLPNAHGDLHGF